VKTYYRVAMLFFCASLAAGPHRSEGGAWTIKRHHWQIFNTTTFSVASTAFGPRGRPSGPTKFRKYLLQNTIEYGLTDFLTLFATPDVVIASAQSGSAPAINDHGSSVEAGARILLSNRIGNLSLQSSYKAAGAFDLSDSNNQVPAREVELRLLYGTGFKVLGADGFADAQVAERWISRQRPNETPVDLTAGIWVRPDTMVMAQSFNIVSGGDAKPPFTYYRSHKVQLSLVERLTRHWLIQLGAFMSPAGQNALDERGISVVLWTQR